jgi:hypothetical protein
MVFINAAVGINTDITGMYSFQPGTAQEVYSMLWSETIFYYLFFFLLLVYPIISGK